MMSCIGKDGIFSVGKRISPTGSAAFINAQTSYNATRAADHRLVVVLRNLISHISRKSIPDPKHVPSTTIGIGIKVEQVCPVTGNVIEQCARAGLITGTTINRVGTAEYGNQGDLTAGNLRVGNNRAA